MLPVPWNDASPMKIRLTTTGKIVVGAILLLVAVLILSRC